MARAKSSPAPAAITQRDHGEGEYHRDVAAPGLQRGARGGGEEFHLFLPEVSPFYLTVIFAEKT